MTAKVSCASRIKEAMDILDMKPTDLVRITGIPKGTMSQYLSGKYEPSQPRTELIAKALNVDEAWLMGFYIEKPYAKINQINENLMVDEDISEYLNDLRNRPEMRMLFKTTAKKDKEQIEKLVDLIKSFDNEDY